MNVGFWMCGALVFPFFIMGIVFGILKEKAAGFVSGFNLEIPAFIIWLVLFFREVHIDTHKAFEKYLVK